MLLVSSHRKKTLESVMVMKFQIYDHIDITHHVYSHTHTHRVMFIVLTWQMVNLFDLHLCLRDIRLVLAVMPGLGAPCYGFGNCSLAFLGRYLSPTQGGRGRGNWVGEPRIPLQRKATKRSHHIADQRPDCCIFLKTHS